VNNDVVICWPLRTPVGRFGGVLRSLSAAQLATTVVEAIIDRSGLDPVLVDEVILGQANPNGEEPAIGRVVALDAGLPTSTTGVQVDRRCGSGLQAVLDGAMRVQVGAAEVVIAGGTESMSSVEHYAVGLRWGAKGDGVTLADRLARARVTAGGRHHPITGGMLETAENLRRDGSISREDQDRLALRSHRLAVSAQEAGRFADEIVTVATATRHGTQHIATDEHPRADTSLDALASLRPIMASSDPEATVTAGNSSGQNDGAAACIVTRRATADRLSLRPMARLVSWAMAGVEPERMGLGPVPATARALERAGLTLDDIDLIELNEAFAAQALAVLRSWDVDEAGMQRVNVNGSGISLGHPVGATGARILATLLHEMARREARYGLETMCIGGGQGLAAVFERIEG
jgi:acetyl-CoA C-acetyltransferase